MAAAEDPLPNHRSPLTSREWGVIFVLAAVQFTHMVDFVIIMPLGKRLMAELTMSTAQFGYIVAAYLIAAGVASLIASAFMDRFDRKAVLLAMYSGFAASNFLCGMAPSYEWLLAARALAGAFGGVAALAVMTIIGDVFPPHKRGRATGAVMSAFAVASILGLPVGLELTGWFGRAAPFFTLAWLSGAVWVFAWWRLPQIREHLTANRRHPFVEFAAVLREPSHLRAFAFSVSLVFGTFTVASFIGPYLMASNGWDETKVKWIYLTAGVCTLLAMNLIGRLADRMPRRRLFVILASAALVMTVGVTNLPPGPLWVAAAAISLFMTFASGRMVPAQAMLLGVAAPQVRGAFLSLNTAVQHFATGLAPIVAGHIVTEQPDKTLTGFPLVGVIAGMSAAVSLILSGLIRPAATPMPLSVVVEKIECVVEPAGV